MLDIDGLGLVAPVVLLDGHQVTVSRHTQVGSDGQNSLVAGVESLQNCLVADREREREII